MGTRNLPENVLFVELPPREPHLGDKLKAVNETVSGNNCCDVIVDFSKIETINSSNISNLLILHSLIKDAGHQLIFCNVSTITKCIFVVAGLSDTFVFSDDKTAALSIITGSRSVSKSH